MHIEINRILNTQLKRVEQMPPVDEKNLLCHFFQRNEEPIKNREEALRLLMVRHFPQLTKRSKRIDWREIAKLLMKIDGKYQSPDLRMLDAWNNIFEACHTLNAPKEWWAEFLHHYKIQLQRTIDGDNK